MRAPFPWFGGKSAVAEEVWTALGRDPERGGVRHYVEPFAGSLAALLHAPVGRLETVNDADGLLANFWRACRAAPEDVADHADWPVNEADLHARHLWLVGQREALTDRLMADPGWCDPQAAGWWVWGCSAWIGSGWCSGDGPWIAKDGRLARRDPCDDGDDGTGIHRQLPRLSDAGTGIHRKLPRLGDAGRGAHIRETMRELAERLRDVRVACGDWRRVTGPSVLRAGGNPVGVLLDPPYAEGCDVYSAGSGKSVWGDVCAWAVETGRDSSVRIVLCGYDGTWTPPHDWRELAWKARGGYGNGGDGAGRENAARERLWLSPGCLDPSALRQSVLL